MTDYELVTSAERVVKMTSADFNLPARSSMADVAACCHAQQRAAKALLKKHGDRLKEIKPELYRELRDWPELF